MRKALSLIFLCCFLCLAACGQQPAAPSPQPTVKPTPAPTETLAPTFDPEPTPEPTSSPEPTPEPPQGPLDDAAILRRFTEAITAMEPSVQLNVAGREWTYGAENDLKNLYYQVLSQHQELKYAYDMTAALTGDTAECSFSYMPYKTGAYAGGLPEGSHPVNSLHDAVVMAQSLCDGREHLSIGITDPSLAVEDLQRAVAQAGYGWIVCTLSRDGTEILAAPPVDGSLADAVEQIQESFRLAGAILEDLGTDGMTAREKLEAVYDYITETVSYDYRYYSDRDNMPYASTVALGALRDQLAICGGYSHALETLLDMCGIENYTVSGESHGEYHAWNYVVLDGVGYYCDPTADRGGSRTHFLMTEADMDTLGHYRWNAAFYPALCR